MSDGGKSVGQSSWKGSCRVQVTPRESLSHWNWKFERMREAYLLLHLSPRRRNIEEILTEMQTISISESIYESKNF